MQSEAQAISLLAPANRRIASARIVQHPPAFAKRTADRKVSRAQARGIRYEKKAQKHLETLYGTGYFASPWIHYRKHGESEFQWAQPDGLLVEESRQRVTVVEIKYSHTLAAYVQLKQTYRPILEYLFPEWRVDLLEVTRWYDCAVGFPCPIKLVPDPLDDSPEFKVHIYNP